jgi:hypothetical protein
MDGSLHGASPRPLPKRDCCQLAPLGASARPDRQSLLWLPPHHRTSLKCSNSAAAYETAYLFTADLQIAGVAVQQEHFGLLALSGFLQLVLGPA